MLPCPAWLASLVVKSAICCWAEPPSGVVTGSWVGAAGAACAVTDAVAAVSVAAITAVTGQTADKTWRPRRGRVLWNPSFLLPTRASR